MSTIVASNKSVQGRSFFIKSNPTIGILTLTAFTDDSNAPQGGFSFTKTFRYSTNGVQWSQWLPLSLPAITAIQTDPLKPFIVEISYFSNEPVNIADLNVNTATLTTTTDILLPTPVFDSTLFKRYFDANDQDVLNWYVNVLEKLWDKGLIPNYLERDALDPDDFLALWTSVTKTFAYYVKFARTFSTFYNNIDILRDFLGQRGLNTSPEDTLPELQQLLVHFYIEMSKRGTQRVVNEVNVNDNVNGEMRRLIHYQSIDEFLFNNYLPQNFGWCLGNSSPLYKGLRVNDSLNKAPWSPGYTAINNFNEFVTYEEGSGTGTIVNTTDNNGNAIQVLELSAGTVAIVNIPFKIDPNLDYEISFQIKIASNIDTFSFIAGSVDINGMIIPNLNRINGDEEYSMIAEGSLSRADKFLMIRCYLYNTNRGIFAGDSTNIGQGSNNLLLNADAVSELIQLTVSGITQIYDFKVLPVQTEYSRGFVQVNNFISAWIKNRNSIYSIRQLEDYISHYLIPYNSHIKLTNIGDYLYETVETAIDSTYWIGSGAYCRRTVWVGADPSCEVQNLIWTGDESTAYCEQG